jgi:aspartate kinase
MKLNKPLIVQKFGGTSVGSVNRIASVAQQIIKTKEAGNHVVVVVSAMSGETNRLQGLAHEIDSVPNARELDVLLSAGEQVTIALLAMTLIKLGYNASSLTGWQAEITTDSEHNHASVKSANTEKITTMLADDNIVIVAGFQGINENKHITTLGRGGSDTTAVSLAGFLSAKECQIFTDVDGVFRCDPRVVHHAEKLTEIDYDDMESMAKFGAKVLHLPCVKFAKEYQLPIRVLSSFSPQEGTLVTKLSRRESVCGIALQRELALISINEEHKQSVLTQCEMLAIDVQWQHNKQILIASNDTSKLLQVMHEEVDEIKIVSAVTLIGSEVASTIDRVNALFVENKINLLQQIRCETHYILILLPQDLDKAANLIHDSCIVKSKVTQKNIVDIS